MIISAKYLDDHYFKNKFYASVGGVPLAIVNEMETEMMRLLNYHCPASERLFEVYLNKLKEYG